MASVLHEVVLAVVTFSSTFGLEFAASCGWSSVTTDTGLSDGCLSNGDGAFRRWEADNLYLLQTEAILVPARPGIPLVAQKVIGNTSAKTRRERGLTGKDKDPVALYRAAAVGNITEPVSNSTDDQSVHSSMQGNGWSSEPSSDTPEEPLRYIGNDSAPRAQNREAKTKAHAKVTTDWSVKTYSRALLKTMLPFFIIMLATVVVAGVHQCVSYWQSSYDEFGVSKAARKDLRFFSICRWRTSAEKGSEQRQANPPRRLRNDAFARSNRAPETPPAGGVSSRRYSPRMRDASGNKVPWSSGEGAQKKTPTDHTSTPS